MENFVQNVHRLLTVMCYTSDIESMRSKFSELSVEDFYLILHAATLQFSYQYDRKTAEHYD